VTYMSTIKPASQTASGWLDCKILERSVGLID
jgi:hypothetical protein